jgi:HK97 family phage portal protein
MIAARGDIGLARAAQKFGARFFANGSKAGGLLTKKPNSGPTPGTPNAKPEQAAQIAEGIKKQISGVAQGGIAVLHGDWDYKQLTINPTDSQFLATRQFQRAEICSIFRVPEFMVASGGSRVTGSSAQQMTLSFVKDTLMPYIVLIEQEFHRKLLPRKGRNSSRFVIKWDLSEMLRGDMASTMAAISLGRQWRVMTGNEAREMLNLDPIAGEDTLLQPVNVAAVDEKGVPHAVSGAIDIPDTAQDKDIIPSDENPNEEEPLTEEEPTGL